MKIDFITYNFRVCGLAREVVEIANNLVFLGNDVTVWTAPGDKCTWLPQHFKSEPYPERTTKTDVLILMDSPTDEHMRFFLESSAAFKTYVITGLNPNTFPLLSTPAREKNLIYLLNNHEVCADGGWQTEHIRSLGYRAGVAVGGINTKMFNNEKKRRDNKVLFSGDKRWAKGYPVIEKLINYVQHNGYSYLKYQGVTNQVGLKSILNRSEVYVDNHTWAGWCNPVLEAMACGCAVICSEIGATSDFAIDGETALVLKPNDYDGFVNAIELLVKKTDLAQTLSKNATNIAKKWDYRIVVKNFQTYLKERI